MCLLVHGAYGRFSTIATHCFRMPLDQLLTSISGNGDVDGNAVVVGVVPTVEVAVVVAVVVVVATGVVAVVAGAFVVVVVVLAFVVVVVVCKQNKLK